MSSACSERSLLPCHNIIHSKQRGIENRRKIGPYCSQMQCNDSKQLHVMFRQLYLVISPVFSAIELLCLNSIQTLIFRKIPFNICKCYAWATSRHSKWLLFILTDKPHSQISCTLNIATQILENKVFSIEVKRNPKF